MHNTFGDHCLLHQSIGMMNNEWAQAVDPVSGRAYYFNRSTGVTSWSPPAVHFPPPPPHFSPPPPQQQDAAVIGQAAAHDTIPPMAILQYQHQQHQTQPLTAPRHTNNSTQYSSMTYQLDRSTATTPGLLLPSVRAIIEKEQAHKSSKRKIELEGVSAGAVADLCNISREWRSRNLHIDGGDFAEENTSTHGQNGESNSNANDEAANHYYKPLQPFSLPLQSRPPHVEPGRVDIRMHSLYKKLRSLAEENTA